MLRRLGTGGLVLVTLAVVIALSSIPLFLLYKSTCGRGEDRGSEYNLVLPWDDPPERCRRHQTGLDLVKDELGID